MSLWSCAAFINFHVRDHRVFMPCRLMDTVPVGSWGIRQPAEHTKQRLVTDQLRNQDK